MFLLSEEAVYRCYLKLCKFHRNAPVPEFLFNKVAGFQPVTLFKRSILQRCFLWIFKNFQEQHFIEHLQAAARCVKKVSLKILYISLGNTCVRVIFNKVTGLQSANVLKKGLQHRCFPIIFAEFLREPFSLNTYK